MQQKPFIPCSLGCPSGDWSTNIYGHLHSHACHHHQPEPGTCKFCSSGQKKAVPTLQASNRLGASWGCWSSWVLRFLVTLLPTLAILSSWLTWWWGTWFIRSSAVASILPEYWLQSRGATWLGLARCHWFHSENGGHRYWGYMQHHLSSLPGPK